MVNVRAKKKLSVFVVSLVGFVAAIITIYTFFLPTDKPRIIETITNSRDGNNLYLSFERYAGKSVAIELSFLTKKNGGNTIFHFSSGSELGCSEDDPHKLCFSTGGNYEIAVELAPTESDGGSLSGLGKKAVLLMRFPSWGSYIYGYESTNESVSLKGTFIIQSFGHIGQGYWAAELRPTG